MDGRLEELLAKQEITEMLHRYCRALDRMDRDLARSVWHEDGTADYPGLYVGSGAGFVDWVWEAHASLTLHAHQVTNALVETEGDEAVSESYVTAVLGRDGGMRVVWGRYLDRWERRHGRWALRHRRFVHDLGPAELALSSPAPPGGRRDRSDPSYELLGSSAASTSDRQGSRGGGGGQRPGS